MTNPRNRRELVQAMSEGLQPRFLFFWGHTSDAEDVGKECLSQWYPAPFELDGEHYQTAEHWMMAEKARIFDDAEARVRILAAKHPGEAKKLGREVRGFDPATWEKVKFGIVLAGSLEKFRQNPELLRFLLGTNERVLVEASPLDRIWGIGLSASDKSASRPSEWKGENLLGFALMQARDDLREGSPFTTRCT